MQGYPLWAVLSWQQSQEELAVNSSESYRFSVVLRAPLNLVPCRDGQPWDTQGRVCCSTALSEGLCFTPRVFMLLMSMVQCLL